MFEHLAFKGTSVIGTTDYPAEKVALAKIEVVNNAYEAEFRKRVGRDEKKLAELKTARDEAIQAAQKYVVPNQFTEIAQRNGAEGLNAGTGLDETVYFWSMPENRLELWAYMESGRLSDTVPREFYKERDVVQEERRMRTDSDPIGRLVEQFVATAFVAHNYGRSGVGWPSEVSQITATEAMEFHKKYYVGSNIVVAVVGDVKASEALPMLERYFSKVPGGAKPEEMPTVEPKQFAEKSVVIREATQPFYIEGYHRPDYLSPDDATYAAISDILSNGRVSRLYRSLVRDQQIAAVAQGFSGFPGSKYPGLFAVYAVPLPGHTPAEMKTAVEKEIEKLKTSDVTDAELAMFKTRARAGLLQGLADNQGLANQLAEYQTRYGDWRELFKQLDSIDKVTKADVRRVANSTFVASNRTSAMIEFEAPKDQTPAGAASGNGGGAR
jgi:predicted Zn-dependent peptidase